MTWRSVRTPEDAIAEATRHLRRPPRVLDFGAGTMRLTVPRILAGHDVWGVDNDPTEVAAGWDQLESAGLPRDRLQLLDASGRSTFPTATFDLVYSEDVLEHVLDLDPVVREIARLTSPGGFGLHSWPGRCRPIESHLRMPGIQLLPRGPLLRAAIEGWTRVGLGPDDDFPGVAGIPRRRRGRVYYEWMLSATRYRPREEVGEAFRAAGFRTGWGRGRGGLVTHEYLITSRPAA